MLLLQIILLLFLIPIIIGLIILALFPFGKKKKRRRKRSIFELPFGDGSAASDILRSVSSLGTEYFSAVTVVARQLGRIEGGGLDLDAWEDTPFMGAMQILALGGTLALVYLKLSDLDSSFSGRSFRKGAPASDDGWSEALNDLKDQLLKGKAT